MLNRLVRPSAFKIAMLIGIAFAALHLARRTSHLQLHYVDLLEAKAVDWKFAIRGPLPLSHKVALAEVDERAVQEYGLWPWNRALVAKAIDKLFDAGAQTVALDMIMADPDRNSAYHTLAQVRSKLAQEPQLASAKLEPGGGVSGVLAVLDREMGQPPDESMHATVVKHKDDLVLGTIGLDGSEAAHFDRSVVEAWDRETRASFIPGAFRISASKAGAALKAVSSKRWTLTHDDLIEAWLPTIAAADGFYGHFSLTADPDGTLRRYFLVRGDHDGFFPSLAMAAVARSTHSSIYPLQSPVRSDLLDGAALYLDGPGLVQVPVDGFDDARMLVNYIAPNASWHSAREVGPDGKPLCSGANCDRVSLADVLDGHFDPAVIKDKLVFMAVTAIGTFDQRVTPFDPFGPGVFVHMNVAEDILSQRFLDHSASYTLVEVAILLALALLFGLLLPRVRLGAQLAILPLGMGGYFGANVALFDHGTQLFTVTPLFEIALLTFGVVFFQYFTVDREKRQVRDAFRFYLTESVMTEMLQDPSKLKLGGEKKNLTVLFSDIRGFTTLSEMLEPSEVVRRLNEYLTPMTNLVFKTGGTLDKYMGDAIMAFWGAPVDQPDHALRACETAVAMLEELHKLRAAWKARGEADIDIGIGLNSGNIHVGNMGSDNRFDYTVIGDDVNLASRLEGTNKSYGTRVIIGENTYAQVKGKVVARELGGVMVKGKKKPVTIFELRRMGTPDAEETAIIASFERGLVAYRARDWDGAEAAFNEVMRAWPGDGPSEKYLEDIADKRVHPPDAGWDGVYVMKTK